MRRMATLSSNAGRKGTRTYEEWLKRDLFERLAQSKFRMRFQLKEADFAYIQEKGMDVIRAHAAQIVRQRLSDAESKNDGKQTLCGERLKDIQCFSDSMPPEPAAEAAWKNGMGYQKAEN